MPQMTGAEAAMVLRTLPAVPYSVHTLRGATTGNDIASFGVTMILSKADGLAPLLECLETLLGQ